MGKISAPEPAPAGVASFQISFPIQKAKERCVSSGFIAHPHDTSVAEMWTVSVSPTLGGSFRAFHSGAAAPLAGGAPSAVAPAPPQLRMPQFDLAAMGGIQDTGETPVSAAPGPCASWMPVPPAQAVERFLDFAYADARAAAISIRYQPMGELGIAAESDLPREAADPALCEQWMSAPAAQPVERFLDFAFTGFRPAEVPLRLPSIAAAAPPNTFVRGVDEFAPLPVPEPVVVGVWAVPNNRPATYDRAPFHLRFSMHTIDEVATIAPAAAQAPAPSQAGPVDAPEPVAVESMPSVPAFQLAALPLVPELRLPTVRCLTAQVLPQARAVAGPFAEPVETMPRVDAFRAQSAPMRPSLRCPSLSCLKPAEEPDEMLATPVAAPGPAPVESMPAVAAFAAAPLPAAPQIVVQDYHPELRAELGIPQVPLPAPGVVMPALPVARPAALDPVARIEATPAGAQPERPKPAIPQPDLIPLEYHSQRIASAPVQRVEAIEPRIAILQQPFAIRPVVPNINDLQKKKILPFEEIFRGKPGNANRVNMSLTGKIAATLMVGLALYSGMRLANLSQHTQQLRAEVAASERTVTAQEAREVDYGKGPIGNLRRAIADRAATEITDTFHAGMASWGAAPKTLAAGWKHHPEGYVSVGDMALFQPSIKYTDYRMEFYGQIEQKSMNWVVRAQDKKNYYAMKFQVIESGLRPIIAMVHYDVVNGKPGRKSETPLSVMIHNNQPYHVAVDVRGNRFTASIEGETVESWTDDAAPRGGVGFFAEAGDKARLYWMRISRNQDWLGRVCAYMSGDGGSRRQTAELWNPEVPHDNPEPAHPRAPEVALAAGAPGNMNSLGKAKTGKQRRSEGWIS